MKVTEVQGTFACEDCGHFKDCPMNYLCPPMEYLAATLLHPDCIEIEIDGKKWKRVEEE